MSSDNAVAADDLIDLVDDPPPETGAPNAHKWRVLVVDDDNDIHEATRFALRDRQILNRDVELLHAHSAAEARQRVAEYDDIAVALIDVVMETPFAGLNLIRELREAGFTDMRIVLRTGQPGYAPELSVITSYEIDDYRTKSELTQIRLLTVLTSSIRAYGQIRTLSRSREGLEMIVEASPQLFRRTNMELFSSGVLMQIASLLHVEPSGIVSVEKRDKSEEGRIIGAVGNYTKHLGKPLAEITDSRAQNLLYQSERRGEPVLEDGQLALRFRTENGHALSTLVEAKCDVAASELALLKLFATNISIGFENLDLMEQLDRLAFIDPVLHIPNQNAFEAALRRKLSSGGGDGRMALVNVDSFSFIAAHYGPRVANQFLDHVHKSLTRDRLGQLIVARVGDSTLALLGGKTSLDNLLLEQAFDENRDIGGIDIASTGTGVIIDLDDDIPRDTQEIMGMAARALLHLVQSRRGHCVHYDAGMRAAVERQVVLRSALKQAVEKGEGITVQLQPKVDLISGAVISAEALLRWHHEGVAISPGEFIPIAEATGLLERLTGFVLDTIAFYASGHQGLAIPVAVNLSMVDLNNPGFAARLLQQIETAGLTSETVTFEVTEGIAMHDTPWAIQQTRALKNAGFSIALDDFGTGYSSLGHFDKLPIDTLKIDRHFVAPLTVDNAHESLAAVVIGMARTLNVACVAEGIETEEQKRALQLLGCPIGQGYLLGRPVPIEEFDERYITPSA